MTEEGYPVADEVMAGGVLIACHQGVTQEMLDHVHKSFEEFVESIVGSCQKSEMN